MERLPPPVMAARLRVLLAAATLVVAACGGQPTPGPTTSPTSAATETPSPTPSPSPSPAVAGSLGEALALAGPVPRSIYFTDWAAIRASVGAEGLTGASAFEEKARAIRNEATLGGFGLSDLRTHASDWGFDVFDLDWEAVTESLGPLIWFLRLRDGFDPAGLSAKLDAYGFATERLPRGVLRTGTLANLRQGTRLLNHSFLNTGLLDDGRTLVLSSLGADEVRAILTDGPHPVADLSVQSVARLLAGPLAAVILVGDRCEEVAQALAAATDDLRAQVDEALAAAGPLAHYNALAIGYRRDPGPIGRIVIGYPEAGQADADLVGRRTLAEEGVSLRVRVRYADRFFLVTDGRVQERAVVLDLAPVALETPTPNPSAVTLVTEFLPRFLIQMVAQRDMLFAACSP